MTSVSPDFVLKGGIAVVDDCIWYAVGMGDRFAEKYRNDRHCPPLLPCALGAVRLAYAGKGREVESARKGKRRGRLEV